MRTLTQRGSQYYENNEEGDVANQSRTTHEKFLLKICLPLNLTAKEHADYIAKTVHHTHLHGQNYEINILSS